MNTSVLTPKNIIAMREKMGFTRENLAKMLGVSSKSVARWENLKNADPPSGTVAIILSNLVSNTLNIPLEEGKSMLITEMEIIHEQAKIKDDPDTIFMLLKHAAKEERSEICKALKIPVSADVYQISKEYRSVAGHTIGNWFRGDYDMPYKTILVDVANKLKPKKDKSVFALEDGRSEDDVERKIIDYFAAKIAEELNKMDPKERSEKLDELKKSLNEGQNAEVSPESLKELQKVLTAGTITAGTIVTLLTGPVTASLFYSGLFAGLWASVFGMSSSLLLLTGTGVGTLLAAPLLLLILGSPSYRKVIPVTLQLINIRRRVSQEMSV